MKIILMTTVLLVAFTTSANAANLIRNAGFETVPGAATGQGIMPSDWVTTNSSPDTYSNDGSYGLPPSGFGNFPGVTAQEGIRWVAGWSSEPENFGQTLSSSLIGGQAYSLSAYLIQAKRAVLDHPGGYEVYLTADATGNIASGVLLGNLGATTNLDTWEYFALSFTAPQNANLLSFLLFKPFGDSAYAGLDNLNLSVTNPNAVPIPAAAFMFAPALLGFMGLRRRSKKA